MRNTEILHRVYTPEQWNKMIEEQGSHAMIKHAVLILTIHAEVVQQRKVLRNRMICKCAVVILTLLLTL